jgi:hypothetical protein
MLWLKFVCVRLNPYLHLALVTRLTFTLHPGILTWFPGDIDIGIQASLIQIYPILLSTLLSINRQTLSLYDASYTLLITSSPLTVYLAVASICDFFGFETDLYKRVKSRCRATRILGALVLFLWLGLSMTLTLSDRAFVNSEDCRGSSFKDRVWDVPWSFSNPHFKGQLAGLGFFPAFALTFGLCLFRRWSQVMEDFRARREGESKLWGRLRVPWTFMKCAWCVSVAVPRLTESKRYQGVPSIATTSGVCTPCSCISTTAGRSRSSSSPSPRPCGIINMCSPMVRCGYLHALLTVGYSLNPGLSRCCPCFLRSHL